MRRKIIRIDEKKCNGCGRCASGCPEGAIRIIGGKARLVNEFFCDGLGACIGTCPQQAITIEERQARDYDEKQVMANIVKGGRDTIIAHLAHLKDHAQSAYLKEAMDFLKEKNINIDLTDKQEPRECACPGSQIMDLKTRPEDKKAGSAGVRSELQNWPIQLKLMPAFAPYLDHADLVIAADCAPFAYSDFHRRFLRGKILINLCPKLDQSYEPYVEKLTHIFQGNSIKSVTLVHMEVPCCFGLVGIVKEAIKNSGENISVKEYTVSIKGDIISSRR
ncbi:MAG: 4Fe-4S binding protein [Candidatus Omnitrophica bacterium]|nr:4Fe-4S binding protein [Candidatus Omnitrophota bacterium]